MAVKEVATQVAADHVGAGVEEQDNPGHRQRFVELFMHINGGQWPDKTVAEAADKHTDQ